MFPCNHAIWSKWAPLSERATLLTISIAGCTIGSVATMPITGLLTMLGYDGGWPLVFYCFGKNIICVQNLTVKPSNFNESV